MHNIDNSIKEYQMILKENGIKKIRKTINYRTKFNLFDKVGKYKVRFLKNIHISKNKTLHADFRCHLCGETYSEMIKKVAESEDIMWACCSRCRYKNRFNKEEK